MVLQAPERTEAVTVRLTRVEKDRLREFALTRDLRVGQVVRAFINQQLAAIGTQTDGPRDGRAAH